MKKMQIIMALALCATLAGADVWDGSAWSEDFTGLTDLPANMAFTAGSSQGSGTTTVGSGQVNWSNTDYRQIASTTATNYVNHNFTFEVTATVEGTDGGASGAFNSILMGMGNGDIGAYMPSGQSLAVWVDPRSGQGGNTSHGGTFQGVFAPGLSTGTYRLQMVWDANTQIATFGIDAGYTGGAFSADYTQTATLGALAADTDSRLIFGGGSGAVFDDVSVIPEPATLSLVGILGGGLLWVRRKFKI